MSEEDAKRWIKDLGITDRSVDEVWAGLYSDNLKLFSVTNTASHTNLFLAAEPKLARVLAVKAGLLRKLANGHIHMVGAKFFSANPAFASAVGRAIREGKPGMVKRDGDNAVVDGVVYPPLYAV